MRASISRGPPRGRSEGGRALGGDCEGALEGDADAAECAFLEEAADQGDAVRHAARWRKLGQRILRIGRPIRRILRSEEHTSELQSHSDLVCRLLLEKKKKKNKKQKTQKHNK